MAALWSASGGEPKLPDREQRVCVHQEGGSEDQRGGGASLTLPRQDHRGAHRQGEHAAHFLAVTTVDPLAHLDL